MDDPGNREPSARSSGAKSINVPSLNAVGPKSGQGQDPIGVYALQVEALDDYDLQIQALDDLELEVYVRWLLAKGYLATMPVAPKRLFRRAVSWRMQQLPRISEHLYFFINDLQRLVLIAEALGLGGEYHAGTNE